MSIQYVLTEEQYSNWLDYMAQERDYRIKIEELEHDKEALESAIRLKDRVLNSVKCDWCDQPLLKHIVRGTAEGAQLVRPNGEHYCFRLKEQAK